MSMSNISAPAPYFATHPYGSPNVAKEGLGRAGDETAAGRKQQQRGLWPSNIQDSEQQLRGLALRLDDDEEAEEDDEGLEGSTTPRRAQERHNSAGLSPVTRLPLPTAGRSSAHRHLGSNSGVDALHEHNELPASADVTAIGAGFNVYEAAAARGRWEAMALGYVDGSSSSSSSKVGRAKNAKASGSKGQDRRQQQYQQEKPRLFDYTDSSSTHTHSTHAQARARSASSSASAAHKKAQAQQQERSGMPASFQRTAPKHDKIGAVLGACPTTAVGGAPPATSNSTGGEAAAFVRVASGEGETHSRSTSSSRSSRQPSIGSSAGSFRQVYDRQPDGCYVRRVDLSSHQNLDPAMLDARLSTSSSSYSSSASADSSRCVSPLDHSVQTFMRVPAAPVEAPHQQPPPPQQHQHHHHQAHRGNASSSSLSASASRSLRPAGLLSTSSTRPAAPHTQRRLTTDVLSPTGSSSCHNNDPLSLSTSHSVYGARNLATVGCRKSSSIVTAATANAFSIMPRPPAPTHRHRRTRGGSSSSSSSGLLGRLREGSMEVLARFGVLTPPSPTRHDPPAISVRAHHAAQSSSNPHATGPPPLLLLPPASTGNSSRQQEQRRVIVHDMAPSHSRSFSNSSSSWSATPHTHNTQQEQHATACVRTALEVITARLQAAQAQGPAATVAEARTFVEGGGVDALLRGLETLGHDPAVAHGLLYTLCVVCRDPAARRAVTAGAKGRMLVERLPAVLRAHSHQASGGVGPVAADGLAVMAVLLEDPVTRRQAAGSLLLTPAVLGQVQEVLGAVDGASREADACVQILKHGVHLGVEAQQHQRAD